MSASPSTENPAPNFGPTPAAERNAAIDCMRGLGVVGISFVLASTYGLQHAAFYRLEIDSDSALDWIAAVVGQVLFDLKASALIMLVLGAGMARLADRAMGHGKKPKRFLLWRSFLLFLIGVQPGVHAPLWEGNYHLFIAFFSVVTVPMIRRSARAQLATGVVLVVTALALTPLFQASFAADGLGLSQYWFPDTHPYFDQAPVPDNHPTGYFIVTIGLRAAGTTLIGSSLYRYGVIQGQRSDQFYRRLAIVGLSSGIPLALGGAAWMHASGYDPAIALVGHMPNTAAAIPVALGYLALIVLWGRNAVEGRWRPLRTGLESVGRMALTNSAVFVVGGMLIIRDGFGRNAFARWELAIIAIVVSCIQMWLSSLWLRRFEFGPLERVLRVVTYRRLV